MKNTPKWLETAVFYEIYPQSFLDTNGDGIGDIPGIIEKLDYIKYLGCNAIWINPWYVSPFMDAGYDVADYYNIAPRYGTNSDAKKLFKEAEKRGIRICLDLVPGHSSIKHPWFIESGKNETNKYTNWYKWTANAWDKGGGEKNYTAIAGHCDRLATYVPNFFYHQPALNFGYAKREYPWQLPPDHPDCLAVRAEFKKIMAFWLDMGASGFRVDMASSLIGNDPDRREINKLWKEYRAWLTESYPEAVLIAEWSNPSESITAGFHVDFMLFQPSGYHSLFRNESVFYGSGKSHSFFRRAGKGDIRVFLDDYLAHYEKTRKKGYISLVTGNHDLLRLGWNRDQEEMKVAMAFLMTMPGVPFIYYGDEIGMDYTEGLSKEGGYERTGSRTPMQWSSEKNAGFSSAPEAELYLPVNTEKGAPNADSQLGKDGSLLETTKALVELRRSSRALSSEGSFAPVCAESRKYPFVYLRSGGGERIVIAVNPCGKPASLKLKDVTSKKPTPLLASAADLTAKTGKLQLSMQGVSFGIFKL